MFGMTQISSNPKSPERVLGGTLIHLDMDADRNGTKSIYGSNEGGIGRIHSERGLIDEINVASKNANRRFKKETSFLKQIYEVIKNSAQSSGLSYGEMEANSGLAAQASNFMRKKYGKNWVIKFVKAGKLQA